MDIRLKNGGLVSVRQLVWFSLQVSGLPETDLRAFWELIEKCRKPDHQIFSSHDAEALEKLGLLTIIRRGDNSIDLVASQPSQAVRDVVCSMVEGELPRVRLVNPMANESTAASA
jgi:hypothetical protein